MNNHFFLSSRGCGICKSLTGQVLLTVVLVDDKESVWTAPAMEEIRKQHMAATAKLVKEAKAYQANLKINVQYIRCKINNTFTIHNTHNGIRKAVQACGFIDEKSMINVLKRKHQVNEAPVIFAVNRSGRSYARQTQQREEAEYGVLFQGNQDYRHELFHVFGAQDLYYPDCVAKCADKYFPDSIMRRTENCRVDDLTAYVIGWTNVLTERAKRFLEETSWISREYIHSSWKNQVKNGKGTMRFKSGTYTGDLLEGIPHGRGKIVWDCGWVYEGEWRNGKINGKGTIVWTDRKMKYTGDWVDGEIQGYGVCTYSDGTTQSGRWEKGVYKGKK